MTRTTSNVSHRQDTGLMEIRARVEDSDGALSVLGGHFFEKGTALPLHVHSREDGSMYVLEGQIRSALATRECCFTR
jgi:quercetin dioxygenase-like cupin family protein